MGYNEIYRSVLKDYPDILTVEEFLEYSEEELREMGDITEDEIQQKPDPYKSYKNTSVSLQLLYKF